MGKFGNSCANALHKEWNSTSRHMINIHGKIGRSGVFFKAFQQKLKCKPRDIFCSYCVRSCFKKVHTHPNCQKITQVYRHMPRYTDKPKCRRTRNLEGCSIYARINKMKSEKSPEFPMFFLQENCPNVVDFCLTKGDCSALPATHYSMLMLIILQV